MARKAAQQVWLECPWCGFQMPIFRRAAKGRKIGHLKKMWCPKCQHEHNFVQLDEWMEYREDILAEARCYELENES